MKTNKPWYQFWKTKEEKDAINRIKMMDRCIANYEKIREKDAKTK